jgi:hypothetical protein
MQHIIEEKFEVYLLIKDIFNIFLNLNLNFYSKIIKIKKIREKKKIKMVKLLNYILKVH